MAPGVPPRSPLWAGPFARTRGSCGHSWGNLMPRVAPVLSPSPTPGSWGVSGDALPRPLRARSPPPGPGAGWREGFRAGAVSGGRARPRPLGPPSFPLRTRLRVPGLAAAASAPNGGGGGASGHGGGRRGRRGRRGLELPGPRSEPPLPHLSTATPSSSSSLLPPDPLVLPPSLRRSHLSVPSSSLHPAPHPGPGLHLSRLGLPHTGRILPWPSLAPNPLHPVCPALGAPDPAPTPARRLRAQGEGGVDEVQGENGGEGSGSGPEPLATRPLLPESPLSPATHLTLSASSSLAPALASILARLLPVPSRLKRHTPFLSVLGEEPGAGDAEELGQHRAGSPQAQLEGRLREEGRSLGRVSQALPPGLKTPGLQRAGRHVPFSLPCTPAPRPLAAHRASSLPAHRTHSDHFRLL